MKYQSEYSPEWQRKFAWFSTYVDGEHNKVWLEHYEVRYVKYDPPKRDGYNSISGYFEMRSLNNENQDHR